MSINKPENLEKYDLIAIMDIMEQPIFPVDVMSMSYNRSDLAMNTAENKVQVYVNARTKEGLKDFKKAYPNAEIQKTAVIEDMTNWKLLAFPTNATTHESALDSYFKGKHDELLNEKMLDAVKRKEI